MEDFEGHLVYSYIACNHQSIIATYVANKLIPTHSHHRDLFNKKAKPVNRELQSSKLIEYRKEFQPSDDLNLQAPCNLGIHHGSHTCMSIYTWSVFTILNKFINHTVEI